MPIRAILFDKDGTLVDFQRTWGPATHEVLTKLCNGDTAAFERLAAASLYDANERLLLPGSPVVIETTYGYGKLWAQALGVPLTGEFVDRLKGFLDFLMPQYEKEGKSYVTISIGCTGGRHRSVFITNAIARHFESRDYRVRVTHRDSEKT